MAKKTKPGKTLVTFLLDRSGSMESIRGDTIGAFNAYLGELKKGHGISFTFLQFDTQSIDKVFVDLPIAAVPDLTRETFVPRGGTPLIDAAFKTIKAVEKAIAERGDKPKVVICIQTDGEENASTEHTWADLNVLIKEKTKEGWQFNFMGASIDAYAQSVKMGISAASTLSYDSKNFAKTRAAFVANASNTASYSAGLASSTAYNAQQKLAAGDAFDPDLSVAVAVKVGRRAPPPAASAAKSIVDDFSL